MREDEPKDADELREKHQFIYAEKLKVVGRIRNRIKQLADIENPEAIDCINSCILRTIAGAKNYEYEQLIHAARRCGFFNGEDARTVAMAIKTEFSETERSRLLFFGAKTLEDTLKLIGYGTNL